MSTESEAYFRVLRDFRDAGAALRAAENATRVAHSAEQIANWMIWSLG